VETVSQLARKYGLSRSTLLYYEACGLLRPSRRSEAGYRLYDESCGERLKTIRALRDTGLPLGHIRIMLESGANDPVRFLQQRSATIDREIRELNRQRRLIARLLSERGVVPEKGFPDRKTWVSRLRRIGVDEAGLLRWHALFELQDPKGHEAFLDMLGFGEEEIRGIRRSLPPLPGEQ
jgi:DNA-binding transcriptional MerR regulator